MIVVDSDVLSYYLIEGERTKMARALYDADPNWTAPALWRAELASVLNKHVKARYFSLAQAREVLSTALQFFGEIDRSIDLDLAFTLAHETGASTYDAHFLALAQQCGRPLVTGEKRHPGARSGLAVNIEDYLRKRP